MISFSQILDSMQFAGLRSKDPLNTTADAPVQITYQFATTSQPGDLPTGTIYTGWTAFTESEKLVMRAELDHIETFLNVDFVEVSGQADPDMNLGKVNLIPSTAGVGGNSYTFSGSTILEYDSYAVFRNDIDLSSDRTSLILHELGHAMGLKHPFSAPVIPDAYDNNKYSIMSYAVNPDNGQDSDAMMLFDVYALQDLWGEADYNTTNTIYNAPRTSTVDLIWDTGGANDKFDAGARTDPVKFDLRQGYFSSFDATDDVVIAFGVDIENADGGKGDDTITGNDLSNLLRGDSGRDDLFGKGANDRMFGNVSRDRLFGEDGNDYLIGGSGNDVLFGGAGTDRLRGNHGMDSFVFRAGEGRDIVLDFENDIDIIRLGGFGFSDAAEALAQATDVVGNVRFGFDDGSVLIVMNTTKAELADDVFII